MTRFLFAVQIIFLAISCKEDSPAPLVSGFPEGFTVFDTVSINDCTLDECADDRVVRWVAEDVVDYIGFDSVSQRYGLGFPYSFDSYVRLYICNLPAEFQENNIKVKYTGELLDACGYYYPIFPIEENYILRLSSITRE